MIEVTTFNVFVSVTLLACGWWLRTLHADVRTLESDLTEARLDVARGYINHVRYHQDMSEVKELLAKIFDRLDQKQDKE